MVGWMVTDIPVPIQLTHALVVGGYGSDLRIAHQCLPGHVERVGVAAALPAYEQCSEQADMGRHQTVIRAHAPEPVAEGHC
ncbi:hypothetical protein [Sphingobacterium chuzhouense]|uniref:Uncharacterized protein n=1 Tax=Sphingobacterium chuzhouense TaxID=1742264 RepID=A0ABR7XPB2_9SPHI|nr:hypothetical protein [Sphingobacterium chuzhouense]MBD1421015.1 hypothetical protein [Sphingobacterium chuzhouense]